MNNRTCLECILDHKRIYVLWFALDVGSWYDTGNTIFIINRPREQFDSKILFPRQFDYLWACFEVHALVREDYIIATLWTKNRNLWQGAIAIDHFVDHLFLLRWSYNRPLRQTQQSYMAWTVDPGWSAPITRQNPLQSLDVDEAERSWGLCRHSPLGSALSVSLIVLWRSPWLSVKKYLRFFQNSVMSTTILSPTTGITHLVDPTPHFQPSSFLLFRNSKQQQTQRKRCPLKKKTCKE